MKIREMEVFKQSHLLAKEFYLLTQKLPEKEKFGLISQMRRAAVSIPSNLIEGNARHSEAEYIYFLKIAIGSCSELEYQIFFCREMKFIDEEDFLNINRICDGVLGLLIKPRTRSRGLRMKRMVSFSYFHSLPHTPCPIQGALHITCYTSYVTRSSA